MIVDSDSHILYTLTNQSYTFPYVGKKSHLLDLVTRITEGHKQKYVTGGGQTGSTSLRVLIYEREGGKLSSEELHDL